MNSISTDIIFQRVVNYKVCCYNPLNDEVYKYCNKQSSKEIMLAVHSVIAVKVSDSTILLRNFIFNY